MVESTQKDSELDKAVDALAEGLDNIDLGDKAKEENSKKEEEEELMSYEKLIEGLKNGKYKKIAVMTGAGISVSAGIPDFRSPGTGIYDNLKEYSLPSPDCLFQLDFFKKNPQPFYTFVKNFEMDGVVPTPTHYFIKLL
jgi:hypothetical protein